MKFIICFWSVFLVWQSPVFAVNQSSSCERQAQRLVWRYLKIVDLQLGFGVEKVALASFRNTTPGTYYQQYQGVFELSSAVDRGLGENQRVTFTFGSPTICEDLKIQSAQFID